MKQKRTEKTTVYKVDQSTTKKNGAFGCPECGTNISPDDCTEETYTILDVKVIDHMLNEIVICCKKCLSKIYLSGFQPSF
jgi:transcription elongation factor Elf1